MKSSFVYLTSGHQKKPLSLEVGRDGVDYIGWEKEGLMELTEGDVTDYNYIKERMKEIAEVVNIQEIAYDRWNCQPA
jgi:phage terminase large subunit-like protein